MEIPPSNELHSRIEAVLKCLYLLFNEGYNSSHPDQLIREELCEEAMRLAYLLTLNNKTNTGQTKALLSLLCFQASRLKARTDKEGNILLLKYQDRSKWHQPLINKGFEYLENAVTENEKTTYHLEAAIASVHARSTSFETTDWEMIYSLYDHLYHLQPSPIVALNRAIAASYAVSKEEALHQLLSIKSLDNYYLYHTSVGEVYFEMGQRENAKKYYEKAILLTSSKQEQHLLQVKIENCIF